MLNVSATQESYLRKGGLLGAKIAVEPTSPYQVENLADNGGFDGGTLSPWSTIAGTCVESTGRLKCTAVGSGAYVRQTADETYLVNEKIYYSYKYYVESRTSGAIFVQTGAISAQIASPVMTTWTNVSGISIVASSTSAYNYIGALSGTMVAYFDDFVIINLTKIFGAGNEPSKSKMDAWLEKYYPSTLWFDGTVDYNPYIIKNEITNGDFSNGITGWVGVRGVLSYTGNTGVHTADGSNINPYITQYSIFLSTTDVYYVKAKVRTRSTVCTKLDIGSGYMSGGGYIGISNPVKDKWYTLSKVGTTSIDTAFYLIHRYASTTLALNQVMEVQYIVTINLTSMFGAGNEPTTSQMDAWLYNYDPINIWFNGTILYPLYILSNDIIENSFSIDRNSVSGNVIEIGNAECSELQLSIDNYDGRFNSYIFEGAILTVQLNIYGEWMKIGSYTVDEVPKKLSQIKLRALDFMAKFNRLYTTSLTGTATLLAILQNMCSTCNVTLNTLSFTNSTYVANIPSGADLTFHQVLIWIAELSGTNAWINKDGQLVLSWYGADTADSKLRITANDRFAYQMDENTIQITGLVSTKSGEADYQFGTTDYALVIEDNGLLNYADTATVLGFVFADISGYTYRPFNITTCGLPYITPMDVITVVDTTGADVVTVVTNHKYIYNHLSTFKGVGESEQESGYATSAPFTAKQKKIINDTAILEASTQVSDLTQATFNFNSLMSNSMGYYETITPDPATNPPPYIRYIHDSPTLAGSTNIYKQTESGFAFSTDGGGTWSSGMDNEGNIIGKVLNVVGVVADWIKTGKMSSTDLSTYFDLDNSEIYCSDDGTARHRHTILYALSGNFEVGTLTVGTGAEAVNSVYGRTADFESPIASGCECSSIDGISSYVCRVFEYDINYNYIGDFLYSGAFTFNSNTAYYRLTLYLLGLPFTNWYAGIPDVTINSNTNVSVRISPSDGFSVEWSNTPVAGLSGARGLVANMLKSVTPLVGQRYMSIDADENNILFWNNGILIATLNSTGLSLDGTADTVDPATHYFVETGTDGYVRPKTLANVKTEILDGISYLQSTGRSTSYGSTNGTSTGALNAIMGSAGGATYLLSGTSGGTFRYGIQGLDAGGNLRFYSGANYCQYSASTGDGTIWHSGNLTYLNGSVTYTVSALPAQQTITTTLTVTGAVMGYFVKVSCSMDILSLVVTAYVSSANTVSIKFFNASAGTTVTLTNAVWYVRVLKK